MLNWIDAILQGILLGGLYALFAAGLSLMFGIMRLVNLAHGDLIVFAAFVILFIAESLGANIFVATLIALPVL
ncbi:MAG: branched-chain amino acid ABC transporter permease, partial [Rhodospirillales bacterium]|nr:branched-chain amino acid ABC transporter permease [Rhodospirillales bacterium]